MAKRKQTASRQTIDSTEPEILLRGGDRYTIEDSGSDSKSKVRILIAEKNVAEVVKVDKGLIKNVPDGQYICDNLVYTVEDRKHNLKITWLIELKGSDDEKQARHCIDQIMDTIGYLQDSAGYPQAEKYLKGRDLVFAAIVGAPDKTLPALGSGDIKGLCKKLYQLSGSKPCNMSSLLFYVRLNKGVKKAALSGTYAPYTIQCYTAAGTELTYPDNLLDLLR